MNKITKFLTGDAGAHLIGEIGDPVCRDADDLIQSVLGDGGEAVDEKICAVKLIDESIGVKGETGG